MEQIKKSLDLLGGKIHLLRILGHRPGTDPEIVRQIFLAQEQFKTVLAEFEGVNGEYKTIITDVVQVIQ